ncbi:DUF1801 domain-containing protein [Carnobacterium divergens]|uniref:DUF1801 domain-containing protein n=1 Tax=Carnobacterium divergens TaxID=2748 RepID=UPI00128B7766|nr:DUF1801 domain-containing protein [Carnobacterium divergens]MPQ21460.1 DUF1801 domain-containing protein [Carnobacterium divergens]
MTPIKNEAVATVFKQYPENYRNSLLEVRQLIFDTANQLAEVGEIEESLKWNQVSYATNQTKSGTPIRLDRFGENQIALFVHCQTTLIEEFKPLFSNQFYFSKNRAILLDPEKELPVQELTIFIKKALTYHLL